MTPFTRVGVVGAGSWGTALALVLHGQGLPVTVWGHDPAAVQRVTQDGENVTYLPGVPIPRGPAFYERAHGSRRLRAAAARDSLGGGA